MDKKIFWLTGQSGAGKSSLAKRIQQDLPCIILDGDEMRDSICMGFGFTRDARTASNLRIARLARELVKQMNVVVAVIAPMEEVRNEISKICDPIWVYIKRSLPERENHFYEEPANYFTIDHDKLSIEESFNEFHCRCILHG